MKTLFRLAHFGILAGFILTGNNLYDKILGGAIAVIAFIYAFTFTSRISDELGNNSILMSLFHWTIRTIISILMILVTRPFFIFVKSIIGIENESTSELFAVALCAIAWIILAEILKAMTGLRKNYL